MVCQTKCQHFNNKFPNSLKPMRVELLYCYNLHQQWKPSISEAIWKEHKCARHNNSYMGSVLNIGEPYLTYLIYSLNETSINLAKSPFTQEAIWPKIPCCSCKLIKSKCLCSITVGFPILGNLIFQIQPLHVLRKLIRLRVIFSYTIHI